MAAAAAVGIGEGYAISRLLDLEYSRRDAAIDGALGATGGFAVTALRHVGRFLKAADRAADAAKVAGRSLDDVIADPKTLNRWLKHSHPTDKPLSAGDAQKVWAKLVETGRTPRLAQGHPGTKWNMPHINVDGHHIPVDAAFTPPTP